MQARSSTLAAEEKDGINSASIQESLWIDDQVRLEGSELLLSRWDIAGGTPRSRRSSTNWRHNSPRDGNLSLNQPANFILTSTPLKEAIIPDKMSKPRSNPYVRSKLRSLWAISLLTFVVTFAAITSLAFIMHSFSSRQLDQKGCRMSYMRPSFVKLSDLDTEHTRFASKYSTYLYREAGVDEDSKVKGVPVLFIPGNAGSYKQVRPIAAEAANYFQDVLHHDTAAIAGGVRNLDFFTVDFNEDITAFHGQTLLDQAEYLNEAISFILTLYHNPRRSERDLDLPDPTSVILLGHSMGGIVARTMLVMPNYQPNSINTIITMSAPHARPPVTFDSELVRTYRLVNDYWRNSYSQKWANDNPLWHVTLISIAGGGLDTVVPSDYASLESLVPETHGFTVFTSSVPSVWTGMDHQAILWCDQFRKVVVRSLYDVIDVNRSSQTKPRADRIRSFKKWYLTGMETVIEKTFSQQEQTILLTLENSSNFILAQGERLIIPKLGEKGRTQAYLLPIPPQGTPGGKQFKLLTNRKLATSGDSGNLEVLFCSVYSMQSAKTAVLLSKITDPSRVNSESTRLACKNVVSDVINLPASTKNSQKPFYLDEEQEVEPFSYLQFDLEDLLANQFVVIVDNMPNFKSGWIAAEFSDDTNSLQNHSLSLQELLIFGAKIRLPSNRSMVVEVKIPALHSSLLAYKLELLSQTCGDKSELFSPLLRQYTSEPYESKFFVNLRKANINLHGVSPFMPPHLIKHKTHEGLTLQFWTDPTCNSNIEIFLKIDIIGSLGKLYMRYRTVFAAFPLLVVALVLRKQFRVYDETGVFMAFSASLDLCLRQSLPLILLALTLLSISLSEVNLSPLESFFGLWDWRGNSSDAQINFAKNDLLMGSQDPFFWFMVPLVGLVCVGVCVIINYATLAITNVLSILYSYSSIKPGWLRNENSRKVISLTFAPSTPRRRILTTAALLFLVSTFIPYQFAYLVACLVQIATCTKALQIFKEVRSSTNSNFYNYTHSILILMLWILPINLPILVVWIHNLAVHWLTPFSSHHNVLSIMPFILLVETLTSGCMVPRITSRIRHLTNAFFLYIAIYAAVYGMTYAYMLHYLVNALVAWLVILHFTGSNQNWFLTVSIIERILLHLL